MPIKSLTVCDTEICPMARQKHGPTQRHTIVYPEHELKPEDLLNFIELDWFVDSWKDLELTDEDLAAL